MKINVIKYLSHRRRSLGANYDSLFPDKQKQQQPSPKSPSQSNAEEPMETNQVTVEESKLSGQVRREDDDDDEEEKVTSSSDCNRKGDPVKAFQEDMDMEGLSGGVIYSLC